MAVLRPRPPPLKLAGAKIGKLTAVRPTGRRTAYGLVWLIQCDCGNTKEMLATEFLRSKRPGQKKSCGCLRKIERSPFYKGVGDLSNTRYRNMRSKAKLRKIPFKVSKKYLWELFVKQKGKCALTGVDLVLNPSTMKAGRTTASVDRVDSSKGYVRGNVWWVHRDVNYMKQSLPLKDFLCWCKLVVKHAKRVAVGKDFGEGTDKEPWLY